uniref:Clp protease N-terminal domain-containing protein n=1 Tax=Herbidospora sakaeratensis TaxID=564415 RepID=UPI000781F6C9|nr:Clp protease N-terminal domain-containing protein [Herbidospora sakaeratensis]
MFRRGVLRGPVERFLTTNARRVLALADDPPTATGITTVLEQARRQARLLGHRYIGTEHLLLALAEVAPDLLPGLGADPGTLRRQVVSVLREPVPAGWAWP